MDARSSQPASITQARSTASPASAAPDVIQAASRSISTITAPAIDPASLAVQFQAKEAFASALKSYKGNDFSKASVDLRETTRLDPEAPGPRFLLGVCYLLTNDTEAGIHELRNVTSLGDSPFREAAYMYMAKAFMRRSDKVNAVNCLEALISLHGKLEAEGRKLREQVSYVN